MRKIFFTSLSALLLLALSINASAQNVGISDMYFTPQSLLHVHSTATSRLLQLTNANTGNNAADGFQISIDGSSNIVFGLYEAAKMAFYTNSAERLTILSDGNIGIGAITPTAKLHILGTAAGDATALTGGILIENNNATSGEAAVNFKNVSTAANYWFTGLNQSEHYDIAYGPGFTNAVTTIRIQANGNVGIGTVNPGQKLDVTGNINFTGALYANGNPGTAGQFLKSNGPASPTWVSPPLGPTGSTGATGAQGVNGNTGSTGATGAQGANGNTGATGSQGVNGNSGSTGATGATGAIGSSGKTGATGSTGATGAQGVNGNTGSTGATGAQGVNGNTGSTGATGAQGVNGNTGATGATGATGTTGATGPVGCNVNNMVIKSNGSAGVCSQIFDNGTNVGIGTTVPAYKLDVNGSSGFNAIYKIGPTSNNPENGMWNVLWTAIAAGLPLYNDEEFVYGPNSVSVYNNSGGTGVQHFWETGDGSQPNTSSKWIRIVNNGNATSPGYGGFYQTINSRRNATFVQRFRAKLPIGYSLNIAENPQGSNNNSYWLTPTDGTGKWEEYIRVSHCGNTGTFSSGGHVYVTGGSSAIFTWYLASCNVYETGSPGSGPSNNNYILNQSSADQPASFRINGTGRANTSFYSPLYTGAGNIAIRPGANSTTAIQLQNAGGTSILNVDATNNNVGIGTTTPSDKLHVNGNVKHNGSMVSQGANYASTWMQFDQDVYGNSLILGSGGLTALGAGESANLVKANTIPGTETLYLSSDGGISLITSLQSDWASRIDAMTILTNGNVGIGTTTPSAQLHTTGTVRFSGYPSGTNGAIVRTDGSGNLAITNFTGNTSDILLGNNTFGTVAAAGGVTSSCGTANYVPKMSSATAMTCSQIFDNGTNVGIGTTTTSYKLQIEGSAGIPSGQRVSFVNNSWSMGKDINTTSGIHNTEDIQIQGWGGSWGSSTVRAFQIISQTGSSPFTNYLILQANLNNGNVGIGTSPVNKLDVEGAAVIGATYSGANSAPANGMLVEGNVGIGTTSPGEKLHVVGNTRVSTLSGTSNRPVFADANGTLTTNGGVVAAGAATVVPIATFGGEPVINSTSWQRVTRTTYSSLAALFSSVPVPTGATRKYYLVLRKADNQPGGTGSYWRFSCDAGWNGGSDVAGHGFALGSDYGSPSEGTTQWVEIPPTAVSGSGGNGYWKIDARMANAGQTMRVMSVSLAAMDFYGGSNTAYTAATTGTATNPALSLLYENIWSNATGGNIGIGTSSPTAQLHTTGTVRLENYTSGTLQVDANGYLSVGNGSSLFTAGTGLSWAGNTLNSVWTDGGNYLYPSGGIGTNLQVADVQSHTYGVYANMTGSYGGYFSGANYGVYGKNSASSNYGYLGYSTTAGVYGYSSTGYGIYGNSSSTDAGEAGVYGYQSTSTAGSGLGVSQVIAGVLGRQNYGVSYHFGVAGYCYNDQSSYPYGGVIGAATISSNPTIWGALGYKESSASEYGGYFNGNSKTTGYIVAGSATETSTTRYGSYNLTWNTGLVNADGSYQYTGSIGTIPIPAGASSITITKIVWECQGQHTDGNEDHGIWVGISSSAGAATYYGWWASVNNGYHFIDWHRVDVLSQYAASGSNNVYIRTYDASCCNGDYLVLQNMNITVFYSYTIGLQAGDIAASGRVYANNTTAIGDLAEHFEYQGPVIPGYVVSFVPGSENEYVPCSEPYSDHITGVLSENPSIVLNSPEQGPPVALAGRVKVKLTKSDQLIKSGDFVTSSDQPGLAQKAIHPGAVIGYAVKNQKPGEDFVEILLQPGKYYIPLFYKNKDDYDEDHKNQDKDKPKGMW